MQDRVEILLACYNGEAYIRQQLDSILAQDYTNWVVRACDDASTDDTYAILEEYGERFPEKFVLEKKENGSGSAKANFFYLLKQSTCAYVMCCDQDDVWLPNKISLSLELMKKTESDEVPVLVHSDLKVVDAELAVLSESFFAHSNLRKSFAYRDILIQNQVTGCTMMMNRALVNRMNLEENEAPILMHDWLAALLATACGRVAFLEEPTILYRQHAVNSVGAKKYGFGLLVSKLKNHSIRKSLEDTAKQAEEVAKTYQSVLPANLYRLTESYGKIFEKNKLYRICFYVRYGVWKKGLPRKVWQLILG
ncbi:MAG: glycosyltransferase family 2 protein [Faecalimonas sp.]|nr:glycosyltransferase family 2 protein [Faecalimonas sp.]